MVQCEGRAGQFPGRFQGGETEPPIGKDCGPDSRRQYEGLLGSGHSLLSLEEGRREGGTEEIPQFVGPRPCVLTRLEHQQSVQDWPVMRLVPPGRPVPSCLTGRPVGRHHLSFRAAWQ